jgi:hypothetical protein
VEVLDTVDYVNWGVPEDGKVGFLYETPETEIVGQGEFVTRQV